MTLPRQNSRLIDDDGRPTREFYDWMRRLETVAPTSATPTSLNSLTNVAISTPADGDVLTYDNTSGKWLNEASAGGGYDEGTSFPGSPASGDKFYRTDLNWLCFYDGTRWLTCQEFTQELNAGGSPISGLSGIARGMSRSDYLQYFTKVAAFTWVNGATNDGSNYWTCTVDWQDSAGTRTALATFSTAADSPNTATTKIATVNAASTSSYKGLVTVGTKVGSASPLFFGASVYYRLIVT
jgi:hypothetical protein